ncbi:MAG: TetR family transcriptional regulator [Planctomycetota bacterium]
MGLSNREEAERTRTRVIDAALSLFSRRGYGHTSLEMIANELGMTRGAIYGHFKNKLDLYTQLMQLSQTPLYDIMEDALRDDGPPLEVLRRFMDQWFDLLENNPRHRASFEILLNKTELTEELSDYLESEYSLTQSMVDGMAELLGRAVKQRDLPRKADVGFHALAAYNILMGVTHTWLFNPRLFAITEMGSRMTEQFFGSLPQPTPASSPRKRALAS